MSAQLSSIRSWASSCWPHNVSVIGVPVEPSSTSKASASEWAGSLEITIVRKPASDARSAVAAATVVLPTPPLPVKSRILMSGCPLVGGRGALDPCLQLPQCGVHDAAFGPSLHEARQRDDEF